jgi:hypothetical protein
MAALNVIPFPVKEANTFDDAWSLIPQSMKTRSKSRRLLRPIWDRHAKALGSQDRLLAALRAYLAGDKMLAKSGGPGLQVWLSEERYDHWLEDSTCSVFAEKQTDGSERVRFPDESIRARIVAVCGEGYTRSYLDPCTLHPDGWITPATNLARGKLVEKGRLLKEAGLVGIRQKE